MKRLSASRRLNKPLAVLGIVVGYVAIALAVSWATGQSGVYPSSLNSGFDTMYYVHRGDFLYRSITREGNWYPILDMSWYNGVETWRLWSPVPAYVLAACQGVAGGSMFAGYLVFVGMLYFLCAMVWLVIGCTHRRPWMGAALGAIWFFIPNNLYMLYQRGALAHSLSMCVMPLLFVGVYDWLTEKRRGSLGAIVGSFFFVTLCHVGWAGMTAVAALIFLALFWLWDRGRYPGKIRYVVMAMALGFLLDSFLVVPALVGGAAVRDSAGIAELFFQPLSQTVDPFWGHEPGGSWSRWRESANAAYFGAAAFGLTFFGGVLSKREHRPGFWAALVICLMTTTAAFPVIALLPGGQYLQMTRLISIALTLLLVSFFCWVTLKKRWQRLVYLLLVAECIPALCLVTGDWNARPPETRYDVRAQQTLVSTGKAITRQRMSMPQPGKAQAVIHELASYGKDAVWSSYGQGIQAAENGTNILRVDQAVEDGQFPYVFDRLLEMGNDTVLIPYYALKTPANNIQTMDAAARAVGYELVEQNGSYRLYHMDTPGRFGVITSYRGIGIGDGASQISLGFPTVEETEDVDLNHYTYDQLSAYDVVYLCGFTYSDRAAAEELVLELSENGTRVVIVASGGTEGAMPAFLGLTCSPVNFYGGYPQLSVMGRSLECDLFPGGYADWKTVYVNGLDQVWGVIGDRGRVEGQTEEMAFLGTVKNPNIVVVGLSLDRHYALTQDPGAEWVLSRALDLEPGELPGREVVPLGIIYRDNVITIASDHDGVNTTLSWHREAFRADKPIRQVNNLVEVDKGVTTIRLRYPALWPSLALEAVGAALTAVFLLYMDRTGKAETRARRLARVAPAAGERRQGEEDDGDNE